MNYLSDVLVCNVKRRNVEKVVGDCGLAAINFSSVAYCVNEGSFVAMVEDKEFTRHLIRYYHEGKSVQKLESFPMEIDCTPIANEAEAVSDNE
mmetsp:Transcript_24971/g.31166  ORF Transcript_24971/g.31166 Transcript_24971/m.31166 type:complete len:93 (-) Transcript_24971:51-329(-)